MEAVMKRKAGWLLGVAAVMLSNGALFASEEVAQAAVKSAGSIPYFVWTTVVIALGFSFTTGICGLGQGFAVKGGLEGIARQPEASDKIQVTMLLGLAFIESLALFALFVNIIFLFANPFLKFIQ
jgi:F-type H+-transporting ATPase subunit c